MTFQEQILQGIPSVLPNPKPYETEINHAPKRKEILSNEEKKLALKNALRYFDTKHHAELIPEFKAELETFALVPVVSVCWTIVDEVFAVCTSSA